LRSEDKIIIESKRIRPFKVLKTSILSCVRVCIFSWRFIYSTWLITRLSVDTLKFLTTPFLSGQHCLSCAHEILGISHQWLSHLFLSTRFWLLDSHKWGTCEPDLFYVSLPIWPQWLNCLPAYVSHGYS